MLIPVLSVGAVIINGSQVLLVSHGKSANHQEGIYGLPSGKVDKFEEPKQACIREIKEETGLIIKPDGLFRLPTTYIADIEMKDKLKRFVWMTYKVNHFTGALNFTTETKPEWVAISAVAKFHPLPNVIAAIRQAQTIQHS